MGFLLGKSFSETLTEFETTNQNIQFNSFMNPERSIDKSAQMYRFKEKGEFQLDFNYMTDAQYYSLLDLVLNRNSIAEGMLFLPIPYSEHASKCIRVPTYNTTDKCWIVETTGGQANNPWGKNWTQLQSYLYELSQTQYGYVDHYDNMYLAYAGATNRFRGFVFQFDLSNFITQFSSQVIRRLTLSYMGMNCTPLKFFIYSPTQAAWYLMENKYYYDTTAFDTPPGGSGAFSLTKQSNVGFGVPWGFDSLRENFIDSSNLVKVMVVGELSQPIILQYVRLLVNGFWVANTDPTAFENFSMAFTGAGRSGALKLMEI